MRRLRLRRAYGHLRRGRELGYPLCCVLEFCWGWLRGREGDQAVRRGLVDLGRRPTGETHRWVACRWHKERHPAWRPHSSRRPWASEPSDIATDIRRAMQQVLDQEPYPPHRHILNPKAWTTPGWYVCADCAMPVHVERPLGELQR